MLRSWWPWAGAGIAGVLWLPNIVWNAQHHWAALSMLQSLHQENSGVGASIGFIPSQIVVVGPVLIVFWLAGLRGLFRSTVTRPLAVTYLALLTVFILSGAKPYYLAGMYSVLFASGGVWAEDRLVARRPPKGVRGWVTLMLIGGLVSLPLALPVLPERSLAKGTWEGGINKDLSATAGWEDFTRQIGGIASTLPRSDRAHLVVFAGDYGAAGAIDLYGSRYGLPRAVSGHNSYWWWGPPKSAGGATIAVNLSKGYLLTIFSEVRLAGNVASPGGIWSEERGDPIWVCTGQKTRWVIAWPHARHYG